MKDSDNFRILLMKGIELNNWILKNPRVVDNGLPEWDELIVQLSCYDDIVVKKIDEVEFDYLIQEFENGVSKITEYMDKRVIITKIKTSIIQERVNCA